MDFLYSDEVMSKILSSDICFEGSLLLEHWFQGFVDLFLLKMNYNVIASIGAIDEQSLTLTIAII